MGTPAPGMDRPTGQVYNTRQPGSGSAVEKKFEIGELSSVSSAQLVSDLRQLFPQAYADKDMSADLARIAKNNSFDDAETMLNEVFKSEGALTQLGVQTSLDGPQPKAHVQMKRGMDRHAILKKSLNRS